MKDKVLLVIYRVLLIICIAALMYAYKDNIKRLIYDDEREIITSSVVENTTAGKTEGGDAPENSALINPGESFTYLEDRMPDPKLVAGMVNNPVSNEFTWTSFEGLYYATICYSIDEELYNYYKSLPRYYGNNEYINYIEDPVNHEYIQMIVENLADIGDRRGYSTGERVREAICFCQNFEYEPDNGEEGTIEWPKYPVELLYDRKGDCEDTSILLAGILSEMGYGVALIKYDDHMAVGLKGDETIVGTFFESEGLKYYYIETTDTGWYIGDIPDNYKDKPATVIVIN